MAIGTCIRPAVSAVGDADRRRRTCAYAQWEKEQHKESRLCSSHAPFGYRCRGNRTYDKEIHPDLSILGVVYSPVVPPPDSPNGVYRIYLTYVGKATMNCAFLSRYQKKVL